MEFKDVLEASKLMQANMTALNRQKKLILKSPDSVSIIRIVDVETGLIEKLNALSDGKASWPLYLYGKVGCGKTLACRAFSEIVCGSLMVRLSKLCEDLRISINDRTSISQETIWKTISDFQLVIIDEIATRNPSDFQYETFLRIIEEREYKPLVIIGNFTPKELSKIYDDRISSRVVSGTVYQMVGEDRRMASGAAAS